MSASKLSRLLCQMQLFAAICGCCVVAACSGFVHHWYRLQGMSDRVNTRKRMHTYTIACCATRIGQLQLSAGCSEYCRMHRACTGFVQHGNTGNRLQGMSDRIDTRTGMHIYIRVFCSSLLCSCGCLQSILVTAVCTGFVQHVLKPRYSLQGPLTDATHSNRCSDVQHAGQPVLFLCRCLLLAAGCCVVVPAQGLCTKANTARYSLLVCLTASTHANKHTYIRNFWVLQLNWSAAAVCRLF
jgi:hypothetical protein